MASGNHPDLFVVDAREHEQDQITIHFVAHRDDRPKDAYQGPAVEDFLLLRAMEGGYRIVLVREAERMNEAAQNGLLKILEEPAPGTLLVLETSTPARLLTTVRSRTTGVDFGPLEDAEVRAVLAERVTGDGSAVGPGQIEALTDLAEGSPGRALLLAERGVLGMRELLEAVLTGERSERGAADKLWELEGTFPGKTPRASARLRASVFLDLGLFLMRSGERELARAGGRAGWAAGSRARRRWRMDQWLRARQDIELNLSPEAAVERALYALAPDAALSRGKR